MWLEGQVPPLIPPLRSPERGPREEPGLRSAPGGSEAAVARSALLCRAQAPAAGAGRNPRLCLLHARQAPHQSYIPGPAGGCRGFRGSLGSWEHLLENSLPRSMVSGQRPAWGRGDELTNHLPTPTRPSCCFDDVGPGGPSAKGIPGDSLLSDPGGSSQSLCKRGRKARSAPGKLLNAAWQLTSSVCSGKASKPDTDEGKSQDTPWTQPSHTQSLCSRPLWVQHRSQAKPCWQCVWCAGSFKRLFSSHKTLVDHSEHTFLIHCWTYKEGNISTPPHTQLDIINK